MWSRSPHLPAIRFWPTGSKVTVHCFQRTRNTGHRYGGHPVCCPHTLLSLWSNTHATHRLLRTQSGCHPSTPLHHVTPPSDMTLSAHPAPQSLTPHSPHTPKPLTHNTPHPTPAHPLTPPSPTHSSLPTHPTPPHLTHPHSLSESHPGHRSVRGVSCLS